MLRFMSQDIQEALEELRTENLELKLSGIRKEMVAMKIDFHRHMDLVMETNKEKFTKILEQTSQTNGSVARAMEKIASLEREDSKRRLDALELKLKDYKDQTKFWTLVSSNKWIAGTLLVVLYILTLPEVRSKFFNLLKLIF